MIWHRTLVDTKREKKSESTPLPLLISYPTTEPGSVRITWESFNQTSSRYKLHGYKLRIYSFNTDSLEREIDVHSSSKGAFIKNLDFSLRHYADLHLRKAYQLRHSDVYEIITDKVHSYRSDLFCTVRGPLLISCPLIAKENGHTRNSERALTLTLPKEMDDECTSAWYVQYAPLEQPENRTTVYFDTLGSATIGINYDVIYRILLHVKLIGGHSAELCRRHYIFNQDLELKLQWVCLEIVHLSWRNHPGGSMTDVIYEVRCSSEGDSQTASLSKAASVNITNIRIGATYQCSVQTSIPGTEVLSNPSLITFISGSTHADDVKAHYYSSGYAALLFVDSASIYSLDDLVYKINCKSSSKDHLISRESKELPIIAKNFYGDTFYNCSFYGIDKCLKTSHPISFNITTYDPEFQLKWLCLNNSRFSWNISNDKIGSHWSNKVTCNGEGGALFEHFTHKNWIDTNNVIIGTTYNCTFHRKPSGTEIISYTSLLSFITGYTLVENIKVETNDSGYTRISFTEFTSRNDLVTLDNLLYQIDCQPSTIGTESHLISTYGKKSHLVLRNLSRSTTYICSLYQVDQCQNRRHVMNLNISTNESLKSKTKSNGIIIGLVVVFLLMIPFATMLAFSHKTKQSRSLKQLQEIESEKIVHKNSSISDHGMKSRNLPEPHIDGCQKIFGGDTEIEINAGTKIANDKKALTDSEGTGKYNYEYAEIKKTKKKKRLKEVDKDGWVTIKTRAKRRTNI